MSKRGLVIGTRGSDLALWQARHVQSLLQARSPGESFPIQILKTQGDRIQDLPLQKLEGGGKGFFTKELEEALLEGRIDLAVHSLKDLPSVLPPGLELGAVPSREDAHDVWLSVSGLGPMEMPAGARVGTSSLRRRAQLRALRPDLLCEPLRGNVPSRVRKLHEARYDAVILARAGLTRLGLLPPDAHELPYETWLPAPGQGALGLEIRADDEYARSFLSPLNDRGAILEVEAERAFLRRLDGGCQTPVGAHALAERNSLVMEGLVAALSGVPLLRGRREASSPVGSFPSVEGARNLGRELAEDLLERGAADILREIRESLP